MSNFSTAIVKNVPTALKDTILKVMVVEVKLDVLIPRLILCYLIGVAFYLSKRIYSKSATLMFEHDFKLRASLAVSEEARNKPTQFYNNSKYSRFSYFTYSPIQIIKTVSGKTNELQKMISSNVLYNEELDNTLNQLKQDLSKYLGELEALYIKIGSENSILRVEMEKVWGEALGVLMKLDLFREQKTDFSKRENQRQNTQEDTFDSYGNSEREGTFAQSNQDAVDSLENFSDVESEEDSSSYSDVDSETSQN